MYHERSLIKQCMEIWKKNKELVGVVFISSEQANLYSIVFQIKPYRFFVTIKFDAVKVRVSMVVIKHAFRKMILEFYIDQITLSDNYASNFLVNASLFRSLIIKCSKEKKRQLTKHFLLGLRKKIKNQFSAETLNKLIEIIKKQAGFPYKKFIFADKVLE